jgi:hypothetical protein
LHDAKKHGLAHEKTCLTLGLIKLLSWIAGLYNFLNSSYDERAAEWHAKEQARLSSNGETPAFVDGQSA